MKRLGDIGEMAEKKKEKKVVFRFCNLYSNLEKSKKDVLGRSLEETDKKERRGW
jgi:hypothetical protein